MSIPNDSAETKKNFLHHCVIELKKTDTILHNLYLFFLANLIKGQNEAESKSAYKKLISYLNKTEDAVSLLDP
jgi:hypothetical protein